jgi:hypothetical protein
VVETPVVIAPAPVAAPAPAAVPPPAPAKPAGGGFRFDPATGRLVIDGAEPEEPAAGNDEAGSQDDGSPAAEPQPTSAAPANDAASAPAGQPRVAPPPTAEPEETLEFDPETGTFKPKTR